jgi:hypothetical protein
MQTGPRPRAGYVPREYPTSPDFRSDVVRVRLERPDRRLELRSERHSHRTANILPDPAHWFVSTNWRVRVMIHCFEMQTPQIGGLAGCVENTICRRPSVRSLYRQTNRPSTRQHCDGRSPCATIPVPPRYSRLASAIHGVRLSLPQEHRQCFQVSVPDTRAPRALGSCSSSP